MERHISSWDSFKPLEELTKKQVQMIKQGVWTEKPEPPPEDEDPALIVHKEEDDPIGTEHREFLQTSSGVVYHGTLLRLIHVNPGHQLALKYLVLAKPKNPEQHSQLKLIADFCDKAGDSFGYCLCHVRTPRDVAEMRFLGNKFVYNPEKDIFDTIELSEGLRIEGLTREEGESWFDAV